MYFSYTIIPYLINYNGSLTIYLYGYYHHLMVIIPLVAGVCVNLTALIWTFHVFYTVRKHGGRISAFIILLIINDLAEQLLSAIIASYLIPEIDSLMKFNAANYLKDFIELRDRTFGLSNYWLIYLQFAFRYGGLYLHLLVALESILSLRNQLGSAHVFSPLCSTISYIILWLLAFGCQFLSIYLNLVFSFLPCCILPIICILACKASPAPDHIKPGSAVLIISTLTLITFCAPAVLVLAFNIGKFDMYKPFSAISVFLISLRVISDPLLCVLVCKEQLRVHQQQTHTEMNTEQRSV